jgi:hypothetical protein
MKVVIAGSRCSYIPNISIWRSITSNDIDVTEIVSGGASGVDSCAIYYANEYNIPYRVFLADWTKYGQAAGPIRNKQMAEYADILIAFPGGRGTANMISQMKLLNKPIYEVDVNGEKKNY